MDIQAYIQSGIIESYVLGMASDAEAAEVDLLRKKHPEVQNAIDVFSDDIERQALANAVEPPAELKQQILNSLNNQEDEIIPPLSVVREANDVTPVRSMHVWKMAAAASIAALVVSIASTVYYYNQYQNTSQQYQALLIESQSLQANNSIYQTQLKEWQSAAEMMADPNMAIIKMPGIKGKEQNMSTVFWDKNTKDVYVMTNKLPAPSAGKQYQLWALVDGKPVDAGMIDATCQGVCKMKNIPKAQAFAITLENSGGSLAPTMEQLFVMGAV